MMANIYHLLSIKLTDLKLFQCRLQRYKIYKGNINKLFIVNSFLTIHCKYYFPDSKKKKNA